MKSIAEYIGVPYREPGVKNNIYVVKRGDSLYSIANKYGISVEDLKNANGISGNLINLGQQLTIPSKNGISPGDYVIYTVKRNDSLWDIASAYGVSVNDIVEYNNLGTTVLQIGQQLLIPTKDDSKTSSSDSQIIYIVRNGDSLWSISKKYNISVNDLKQANNLKNNMLSIGQQLIIPETSNYETYIVKSGDSLWKIAQNYDINVNDLIKANNLNSNVLSIGQTIIIPR